MDVEDNGEGHRAHPPRSLGRGPSDGSGDKRSSSTISPIFTPMKKQKHVYGFGEGEPLSLEPTPEKASLTPHNPHPTLQRVHSNPRNKETGKGKGRGKGRKGMMEVPKWAQDEMDGQAEGPKGEPTPKGSRK
ncbi:hypothetical protein HDU67_006000, partial [Dinochytrium kinnereticum]